MKRDGPEEEDRIPGGLHADPPLDSSGCDEGHLPLPRTAPAKPPPPIDPILALLDFLHDRRASRACWLIGGPAAVDDLRIAGAMRTAGVRLSPVTRDESVRSRSLSSWVEARDQPWLDFLPTDIFDIELRRLLRLGMGQHVADKAAGAPLGYREGLREAIQPLLLAGKARPGLYPHREAEALRYLPGCIISAEVARAFRAALVTPGRHTRYVAETAAELAPQVARVPELPEALFREFVTAADCAETGKDRHGRHASQRLLFADVAQAGVVGVRLGRVTGQFWAIGTRQRHRGVLADLPGALRGGGWGCLTAWLAAFGGMGTFTVLLLMGCADPPRQLLSLVAALLCTPVAISVPAITLSAWRRSGFLGYLRQSRKARPGALVIVTGPEPCAAGLLFSLFAHLAAHAQLDDAREGGALLDGDGAALLEALAPGAPAPEWSATYRMEMGDGVPGPKRVRFVHLVGPSDGGRVPARADQVWLVVPRGVSDAEDCAFERAVLGRADRAPVLCVRDVPGAPGGFTACDPCRALSGRAPDDACAADLAGLRDRYLAGHVTPREAAESVRLLLGGPTG